MEGYMNVSGSHRNFDDLDIEGYSEWNAGDEDFYSKKVKNGEEKSILETKVQLDDGKYANMCSVVEKDRVSWYTCHVCTVTVASWSQFNTHIKSKLHANSVNLPTHPRAKFAKLDPKEKLSLEPGEPVPPGLEEVIISTCEIQKELDAYTTGPLIGLEYLVELSNNAENPLEYFCLLCDRRGNCRNIMVHLTSQSHYMKYLSQFFRTAAQKLQDIPRTSDTRKGISKVIVRIASRIESKFGRMKPIMEPQSTFAARKFKILHTVDEGVHFRETEGDTFADCINLQEIKSLAIEEYRPPEQIIPSTKLTPDIPMEIPTKSLFNKGRIGADKRQLRVRNESSPINAEVITVDDTPPNSPANEKQADLISQSQLAIQKPVIQVQKHCDEGCDNNKRVEVHNLNLQEKDKLDELFNQQYIKILSMKYEFSDDTKHKLENLQAEQERDPKLVSLKKNLLHKMCPQYKLFDNVLYKQIDGNWVIMLPNHLIYDVTWACHVCLAHADYYRCYKYLLGDFICNNMLRRMKPIVKACPECLKFKYTERHTNVEKGSITITEKKPRLHSSLSSISNKSLSPSKSKSRSRSRVRSRSRSQSHSHKHSAYDRSRPVRRSRSDSRHHRRYCTRSLSKGGRKRSRSRSKSGERYRPHYSHRSPPSFPARKRPSPSSGQYCGDNNYSRGGRSRLRPDSPPDLYRDRSRRAHIFQYDYSEEKSEGRFRYNRTDVSSEKYKWEKFRDDFKKMETEMYDKLKYYEKNPEKHPMYPEEWKAFWNHRYKELKAAGRDPAKHDFKPEWITFWNKRIPYII